MSTGHGHAQEPYPLQPDAEFFWQFLEYASMRVSGVGDVNGDGYDDLLFGEPQDDWAAHDAGQAFLVLGRPQGWALPLDLEVADASFLGEGEGDHAGWVVRGAGDVDGDGLADILISAPWKDGAEQQAGKVYLFLGRAQG